MQRVRKIQCDWDNCRLAARLQVLATSLALFSACIGTAIYCVWLRLYSLGCEFNEARDCKNIRGITKTATKSYKQLQQSKHLTELHAANPSTANTRKRSEDCSTNADRHGISQTVSRVLGFFSFPFCTSCLPLTLGMQVARSSLAGCQVQRCYGQLLWYWHRGCSGSVCFFEDLPDLAEAQMKLLQHVPTQ